jgi:hypothetical protein
MAAALQVDSSCTSPGRLPSCDTVCWRVESVDTPHPPEAICTASHSPPLQPTSSSVPLSAMTSGARSSWYSLVAARVARCASSECHRAGGSGPGAGIGYGSSTMQVPVLHTASDRARSASCAAVGHVVVGIEVLLHCNGPCFAPCTARSSGCGRNSPRFAFRTARPAIASTSVSEPRETVAVLGWDAELVAGQQPEQKQQPCKQEQPFCARHGGRPIAYLAARAAEGHATLGVLGAMSTTPSKGLCVSMVLVRELQAF